MLGPLSVTVAESQVSVGSAKERAVLTLLALRGANGCPAAELVAALWGDRAPRSAAKTLQTYVSKLRQALPAGVIATTSNGYVLVVAPDAVDVARFETAVALGRGLVGAGDRAGAVAALAGGLGLWRGRALVDLVDQPAGMADAARLEELRRSVEEELAELRLALGQHQAMVGDLEAAVAAEPLRERRWVQLMLALYRSGRHADALRAFQRLRRILADDLGLAPSVETRAVEAAILAQDAGLSLRVEGGDLGQPVDTGPPTGNGTSLCADPDGPGASARLEELHLGAVEELALAPGPGPPQLGFAILAREASLGLPAPAEVPVAIEAGRTGPATGPAGRHGRPIVVMAGVLVAGALVAGALVLVGAVESGGGRAAPVVIPADAVGAISPSGGAIGAVAALGTSPSSLAGGDGSVWVADADAGTVARIDPRTHTVVETLPVGSSPSGIAVGAAAVWVTDNLGRSLSRVDPAADRVVQTIPVGNGPEGVAVGDGAVWVANASDGTVSRIDPVTGGVVDTIALGAGATEVTTGMGAVWVSDETGDCVFRVNPASDEVTASIHVGTGPTALVSGFGSVWVANSLDGTVSRIDPHTNTVTATVAVGDGAGGLAVGAGGVWVTSPYAGTVSRIDPATTVVRRTVTVGSRPQGVAVTDGQVWVGDGPADTVHRGGTLTVLATGYADTMDPLLTQNLIYVLPLAYDGLTAYQRVGGSGSNQLVPDLALSLPAPTNAGTTYTFVLRGGIRYSNGEPLRPEDFRRALERDLILGGNDYYGGPFAAVVGGAACAAHPSRCDLSQGVVVDDAADTVTFHLMAPNPEFLDRLTLPDAYPVPAGIPDHDIGLTPMPSTSAYQFVDVSRDQATLVRNPYFREWSHAARPDGYPDRIVFRHIDSWEAGITAVEHNTTDYMFDGVPPDRLAEAQIQYASRLYITPTSSNGALLLNTRKAPFTDLRVRQAINYAVDRARVAALVGGDSQPACQVLPVGLPGYRPYCPYTSDPNPAGTWNGPDLARAERLIQASGTRGTPITIWELGALTPADQYLASLLDRLGYPTHIKEFPGVDATASLRAADSRTAPQAFLDVIPNTLLYPSAAQVLQANFSCQSFVPDSTGNANLAEFCDPSLDAQIERALTAESNNAPDTAAQWTQADRTATDQAPAVPLTTNPDVHLVSARVADYQYSFAEGVLIDQLWVH